MQDGALLNYLDDFASDEDNIIHDRARAIRRMGEIMGLPEDDPDDEALVRAYMEMEI